MTREKHLPFEVRRALLLHRIDLMDEVRDRAGSYEKFNGDMVYVLAASALLMTIGELLHPAAGHASQQLSATLHEMRNKLTHEYSNFPASDMWAALNNAQQLRDEVMEHRKLPIVISANTESRQTSSGLVSKASDAPRLGTDRRRTSNAIALSPPARAGNPVAQCARS